MGGQSVVRAGGGFRLEKEPQYWARAISTVVRRLRSQRKLTLKAVGDRTGWDRNYIWELENRDRIARFDTVARLARGFELPLTTIVGLIEKEHEKIKKTMRGSGKFD